MSKNASPAIRRLFRLTLLCAALGFGIKSFLLSPLYVSLASNVLYSNAWWMEILYQLTSGGLIDLAVFAICYPATLYAVRREGFSRSLSIPIVFSALTLAKFVANFFVTAVADQALPDIEEFLTADLPMILVMFLLEWIQYILVVLIAIFVRWRYDVRARRVAENARLLPEHRKSCKAPSPDFPFRKIYDRYNGLQRGALLSAIMVVLGRVVMHLIYQITLFVNFGSSDGWVVMLIDLISDLVVGVIFYLVAVLLMMRFYRAEQKDA